MLELKGEKYGNMLWFLWVNNREKTTIWLFYAKKLDDPDLEDWLEDWLEENTEIRGVWLDISACSARDLDDWLDEYAKKHREKINRSDRELVCLQ